MQQLQNLNFQLAVAPVDATGASLTGIAIDSVVNGVPYKQLCVVVITGNVAADMTALKLTECETSGGSYTDVSGADFSASGQVLPLATGGDNKVWAVNVNLASGRRKRFFKLAGTAGAGATLIGAVAILTDAAIGPTDDTLRGLSDHLIVG